MRDRIKTMRSIQLAKLRGFAGGNPKSPTTEQLDRLADSIDDHGYVLPVAVRELEDSTYELIDGHSRVAVIAARNDPNMRIKCLILDVESVAEGRRILLALQQQVGFDTKKLDAFIRDALADGVSASDLMRDSGMTGADLDAFAAAGQKLVDGLGKGPEDPDETNEGVSRAGLIPEHVQFGVPLTREQNKLVHDAIKLSKQLSGRKISGDALAVICAEYLDAHRTHEAAPKKKRGRRGA
jgi:hypothetical protein